jgi:hypothetical protein
MISPGSMASPSKLSEIQNTDALWIEVGCGDVATLAGAGEDASGVLIMRLVSLWWELPPRLDSNNRIPGFKMQ